MTLWQTVAAHRGRPIHKWHHYFPVYERHLSRYVGRPFTLVEIGCGAGGSLQLWRDYFGPLARIVGVDIREECRQFEGRQISVRIGDQASPKFWSDMLEEFGPPDAVIDDGSHQMADQIASFRYLYHAMDRHGVYLAEDLHTSYWPNFGGGLRKEGSFIEFCKSLIDELNADHTQGHLEATPFTRETVSLHFYDSIVVFEKGPGERKKDAVWPQAGSANGGSP